MKVKDIHDSFHLSQYCIGCVSFLWDVQKSNFEYDALNVTALVFEQFHHEKMEVKRSLKISKLIMKGKQLSGQKSCTNQHDNR